MAILSYHRSPLAVLSVRSASPDEVIHFLNRYSSDQSYSLVEHSGLSERAIQIRGSRDRTTLIGLLPSYYLVYDPDRGGVQFIYDDEGLCRIGIDPSRLHRELKSSNQNHEGTH